MNISFLFFLDLKDKYLNNKKIKMAENDLVTNIIFFYNLARIFRQTIFFSNNSITVVSLFQILH